MQLVQQVRLLLERGSSSTKRNERSWISVRASILLLELQPPPQQSKKRRSTHNQPLPIVEIPRSLLSRTSSSSTSSVPSSSSTHHHSRRRKTSQSHPDRSDRHSPSESTERSPDVVACWPGEVGRGEEGLVERRGGEDLFGSAGLWEKEEKMRVSWRSVKTKGGTETHDCIESEVLGSKERKKDASDQSSGFVRSTRERSSSPPDTTDPTAPAHFRPPN